MGNQDRDKDPTMAEAFPNAQRKAYDKVIKSPTTPDPVRDAAKRLRKDLDKA